MICTHVPGRLLAILGLAWHWGQMVLWLSPADQRVASVLMGISIYKKCCCRLLPGQHQCSTKS